MPWAPISEPALGLAILKAKAAAEGIEARVFHFGPALLRYLTAAAYQQVGDCWSINEFTFSGLLDDGFTADQADALLEQCHASVGARSHMPFPKARDLGHAAIQMRQEIVPQFLAECAEELIAYEPTLVGFTCMFDQTIASLALASLLRRKCPDVMIVLGGYAMEGPPGREVLRAFPHIDAIAEGDGEPIIALLAQASVGRGRLSDIGGVFTRDNPLGKPRIRFELDGSPAPDYSDWFADLAALAARDRVTIKTTVLPVESSRGCWWGQKHHCVFCGIDDQTLTYRTKKPATVLAMLAHMRERYGTKVPFRFSDYIFPNSFVNEVLPKLAQIEPRYELQCEIKANQSADRIRAFADAGFTELQPGIESFETGVLGLMEKGVTGIHNVQTIKLGYVNGIQIHYNILYGLPGEKPEWYLRMIDLVPRLYHLAPPISRTEAIVTRFAPLHSSPQRFGSSTRPRHHRCYDCLFSGEFLARTRFDLDNYAYYFERYFEFDPAALPLYGTLIQEINHWKTQHRERDVFLSWEADGDSLVMRDTRFAQPEEIRLSPLQSQIYRRCDDTPMTLDALSRATAMPADEVKEAVAFLDEVRLIWREGEQILGLAVPSAIVARHRKREWSKAWTSLYC